MKAQKTVVLLGPAGSFSHQASEASLFKKHFRQGNYRKHLVSSIAQVFKHVKDRNTFGFVPIRNKIVGKIPEALQLLKKEKWHILARHRMRVDFVVAVRKKMPLSKIKRLYVAKIAEQQCAKFIRIHLKNARKITNFAVTSFAYKKIVQLKGFDAAAIGSESGAKLYKLKILAQNIQDDPGDWTEFVLFQRKEKKPCRQKRGGNK